MGGIIGDLRILYFALRPGRDITGANTNSAHMKNQQKNKVTRREFLKSASTATAVAIAMPTIIPSTALGRGGKPAPSERINIGIIGCGGMGTSNLTACAREPDVVVTAACDVWDARLDVVVERYKGTCKGYKDFREMLQQKELDGGHHRHSAPLARPPGDCRV